MGAVVPEEEAVGAQGHELRQPQGEPAQDGVADPQEHGLAERGRVEREEFGAHVEGGDRADARDGLDGHAPRLRDGLLGLVRVGPQRPHLREGARDHQGEDAEEDEGHFQGTEDEGDGEGGGDRHDVLDGAPQVLPRHVFHERDLGGEARGDGPRAVLVLVEVGDVLCGVVLFFSGGWCEELGGAGL